MAEVTKQVLVEYTPAQMFELVDRCEDYEKFLPWCDGADLLERTETITAATLHVNYHGIKTKFSTENSKFWPHEMHIRLRDGPFRHLEGYWKFVQLGQPGSKLSGCKVEFNLRYQFASRLLEKAIGPVFNHIASTFVDAFVKRAGQVYGAASS